ncbi:PIN domain-containing protein, partial [Klebsiella pneumoniae]|uniref:type II toxin-antitoxin system VapC family toxin n=1 Tax=Klebsiella pneumoniae TaxID=573 RepID=UPI003976E96C
MKKTWMLDTNICSFIMREQPAAVLKRLEQAVLRGDRIVVSAVTYAEMRFGATGPKASPRHIQLVDAFCARLDAILPWDRAAVDATTDIRVALRLAGTPIAQVMAMFEAVDRMGEPLTALVNNAGILFTQCTVE